MQTLSQVFRPEDLQRLQAKFSFNVGEVPCEWGATDGQFNKMASAKSDGLFSSRGKIIFDPTDFPRESPDFGNALIRETIIHELIHIMQYRRGFFYRLQMKFWNATKKYLDRPHEKEAHEKGHIWAGEWQ